MHSLSNNKTVFRFRLAAFLLFFNLLLIPGSWLLLVVALLLGDRDLVMFGLVVIGASLVIFVIQRLAAASVRCPLCIGYPLTHSACVKHASAQTLFGSYRMKVASSINFKGYFRCPFCGESTSIDVRRRRHRHRGDDGQP